MGFIGGVSDFEPTDLNSSIGKTLGNLFGRSVEVCNGVSEFFQRVSSVFTKNVAGDLESPSMGSREIFLLGSVSSSCLKIINYVAEFFGTNPGNSEFFVSDLSDFKGATKIGDYSLPGIDKQPLLTGASKVVRAILEGSNLKTIELKGEGDSTIKVPHDFARDICRTKDVTICEVSNKFPTTKDLGGEDSEAGMESRDLSKYQSEVISLYKKVEAVFNGKGIGESGLFAALEVIQQGITADASIYLTTFNNDTSALQSAIIDSIAARFEGAGDSEVFSIEIKTIFNVSDLTGDSEKPPQKKGDITLTQTLNISVTDLKKIEKQSSEESDVYSYSNLPGNVTGSDVWSAFKPYIPPTLEV